MTHLSDEAMEAIRNQATKPALRGFGVDGFCCNCGNNGFGGEWVSRYFYCWRNDCLTEIPEWGEERDSDIKNDIRFAVDSYRQMTSTPTRRS